MDDQELKMSRRNMSRRNRQRGGWPWDPVDPNAPKKPGMFSGLSLPSNPFASAPAAPPAASVYGGGNKPMPLPKMPSQVKGGSRKRRKSRRRRR